MLAGLSLAFFIIKLVLCVYEDDIEYSDGYGGNADNEYSEGSADVIFGADNNRVRRFENRDGTSNTRSYADIKSVLEKIMPGHTELFSDITHPMGRENTTRPSYQNESLRLSDPTMSSVLPLYGVYKKVKQETVSDIDKEHKRFRLWDPVVDAKTSDATKSRDLETPRTDSSDLSNLVLTELVTYQVTHSPLMLTKDVNTTRTRTGWDSMEFDLVTMSSGSTLVPAMLKQMSMSQTSLSVLPDSSRKRHKSRKSKSKSSRWSQRKGKKPTRLHQLTPITVTYFQKASKVTPSQHHSSGKHAYVIRQDYEGEGEDNSTNTTTTTTTRTTTTTTTRTTTTNKHLVFDIESFLVLLANLTYDYDTNLTDVVNATLRNNTPTCPPRSKQFELWRKTSVIEETTTPKPYEKPKSLNNTVIAKCFVCGLKSPGIPFNSDCADAFAGDFLPLTPYNPVARAKTSSYRKYCRYGEIYNYHENATRPRSVYGRWTGGCSVRWTDLTGLYTQRACRNRRRAVTGLHYASKRMAKLEMALGNAQNECIISPVATLLPLSRGVSLFARFHACVCTGNWCNRSVREVPGPTAAVVGLVLAIWPYR